MSVLKREFTQKWKFCHHLLTSCYYKPILHSFFPLWNTKEIVFFFFVYTENRVNGVYCCVGPSWRCGLMSILLKVEYEYQRSVSFDLELWTLFWIAQKQCSLCRTERERHEVFTPLCLKTQRLLSQHKRLPVDSTGRILWKESTPSNRHTHPPHLLSSLPPGL